MASFVRAATLNTSQGQYGLGTIIIQYITQWGKESNIEGLSHSNADWNMLCCYKVVVKSCLWFYCHSKGCFKAFKIYVAVKILCLDKNIVVNNSMITSEICRYFICYCISSSQHILQFCKCKYNFCSLLQFSNLSWCIKE